MFVIQGRSLYYKTGINKARMKFVADEQDKDRIKTQPRVFLWIDETIYKNI